ncbi:MAG: hypothetical protein PHR28_11245 [candidate division Zixibacteria bacterium]|nr:hypothetical protein [candidate division Zixibacteria bacterium]
MNYIDKLDKNIHDWKCRMDGDETSLEEFIEGEIRAAIREYDAMVNVKSYEENEGDDCPPIIERFSRKQALAAFGVDDK